ncbi:MAG: bifunctional hydroxymethylpyrimidine kinase/phosphomethylpyrimidine kinase [Desulfobacterales bacterium]|nr:bifunctional hydroxymethylpyrimidine kinase/phosphomethylpyrimidine kinase [Desulfobacterales bacterium]
MSTSRALPTSMALSIAGSDPSGGAGIQADLKTFCMVGVYGGAVITCLTAQNTRGVASYRPVDPELVGQQIKLVLQDLPVSHIKIGMVGTGEIAIHIGAALENFSGEIVCDPVLAATSGLSLLKESARAAYRDQILARATVLIPNLEELSLLAERSCANPAGEIAAGRILFDRFPRLRSIVIKGGHRPDDDPIIDRLLVRRPGGAVEITARSHPRVRSRNTHGTGCTMAAAFTAHHLLENDDSIAFDKSVHFMDHLLTVSEPSRLGHGIGPLLHHLAR